MRNQMVMAGMAMWAAVVTVGCGGAEEAGAPAPELAQAEQEINPVGVHDASNSDYYNYIYHSGWTCDGDNYAAPTDVHIYVSRTATGPQTFLKAVRADLTRSDLYSVCAGYTNHAFNTTTSVGDACFKLGLYGGNFTTFYNVYFHVYSINLGAGTNQKLGSSPRMTTIRCFT